MRAALGLAALLSLVSGTQTTDKPRQLLRKNYLDSNPNVDTAVDTYRPSVTPVPSPQPTGTFTPGGRGAFVGMMVSDVSIVYQFVA